MCGDLCSRWLGSTLTRRLSPIKTEAIPVFLSLYLSLSLFFSLAVALSSIINPINRLHLWGLRGHARSVPTGCVLGCILDRGGHGGGVVCLGCLVK